MTMPNTKFSNRPRPCASLPGWTCGAAGLLQRLVPLSAVGRGRLLNLVFRFPRRAVLLNWYHGMVVWVPWYPRPASFGSRRTMPNVPIGREGRDPSEVPILGASALELSPSIPPATTLARSGNATADHRSLRRGGESGTIVSLTLARE